MKKISKVTLYFILGIVILILALVLIGWFAWYMTIYAPTIYD